MKQYVTAVSALVLVYPPGLLTAGLHGMQCQGGDLAGTERTWADGGRRCGSPLPSHYPKLNILLSSESKLSSRLAVHSLVAAVETRRFSPIRYLVSRLP